MKQPRNKILEMVNEHVEKYGDIHYVVVPTETLDRIHVLTDYGREKLDSDTLGGHIVIKGLKKKLNMAIKTLEDIAGEDYRGNRSSGSVKAFKTLKELKWEN